ncbi:hypothetical protein P4114_25945 [Pseudomonas aeruginosa]|nr:hypothetical protein [Pseudomonas aeruginosa]
MPRLALPRVAPTTLRRSRRSTEFAFSAYPAADRPRRVPGSARRNAHPLGYRAHDCYRERIRIRPRAPSRHQPPITTITRCRPCTRS